MSKQESIETFVIGAGPKGLSTTINLQKGHGLNVITMDMHGAGASWRRDQMNPRLALNPTGWEIVNDSQYTFQNFWDNYYPKSKKKKNPLHNECFTATHYRHYLEWLDTYISSQKGEVVNVEYDVAKKHFEVEIFDANKSPQILQAQSVVVSSGLTGYGGMEFVHDPTGLQKTSRFVKHMPKDLRTDKDTLEFLSPSKKIAVIGAGNSAAALFWMVQKASWVEDIHLFTAGTLDDDSDANALVERVPPFNYQKIMNEERAIFHPKTEIVNAREEEDKIVLVTDTETEFTVDKVVVTAGYRYDFVKVPFTRGLRNQGLVNISGRYPAVNAQHQIVGNNGEIEVYMIGEGAAALGKDQRLLFSTAKSVEKITESILNNLGEAGK